MTYGTIKVDTVTFTDAGVDKSVTLSGLVQNPVFSGNVTVTGTLSGVTVTGTTANFTSGNFTNISGGTHTIASGVFAAGSAASPSITFTGDLNTGIYSPGADQVAISTGGSGRLFVDASGNVGVGVSASAWGGSWKTIEFLNGHSFGSAGTQAAVGQNLFNNGSNWIYKTSAPASFYQLNSGEHIWYSAPSGTAGNSVSLLERLRITSAGLVGIGTSVPDNAIHVSAGSASVAKFARTTNEGIYLSLSRPNKTYIAALDINNNGGKDFTLYDATAAASRITVTDGGSVGIGTTSPGYALHVVGTINSSDANIGFRTALTNGLFQAREFGGSSANNTLEFNIRPDSGKSGYLTFTETSVADRWSIGIQNGSDGLRFISGTPTTGTERCRIDGSGRLLVGTSTAQGDGRIQVQGSNVQSKLTMWRDNAPFGFIDGTAGSSIEFGASPSSGVFGIGASIQFFGDQTWGANDYPGRLVFSTTADGASSPTERMRITRDGYILLDGNLGAVGMRVGSAGQLLLIADNGGLFHQAGGNYYLVTTAGGSTSDINLKRDIIQIAEPLQKLSQIRGVTFVFSEEPVCDADKGPQIGVIAQEVEAVFPQAVVTNEQGIKSVRYDKLVAPLIEAVNTLAATVANQNALIEDLAQRLAVLEAQ